MGGSDHHYQSHVTIAWYYLEIAHDGELGVGSG